MIKPVCRWLCTADGLYTTLRGPIDFLPPLLLRIFLAPIFIYAGYGKLQLGATELGFFSRLLPDPSVVQWFDLSLGLPLPGFLAFMAGWTEFLGGWFLLFGLLTRYVAIPLMATMVVAAVTVHWQHGWHTLPETKLQVPWEWKSAEIEQAVLRKNRIKQILKRHSDYDWLSEYGSVTVLRNGIEQAAIYFIMLLTLVFTGAGRLFSIDYWVGRWCRGP